MSVNVTVGEVKGFSVTMGWVRALCQSAGEIEKFVFDLTEKELAYGPEVFLKEEHLAGIIFSIPMSVILPKDRLDQNIQVIPSWNVSSVKVFVSKDYYKDVIEYLFAGEVEVKCDKKFLHLLRTAEGFRYLYDAERRKTSGLFSVNNSVTLDSVKGKFGEVLHSIYTIVE